MDGHASPPGDKPYDLISGNGTATLGETHSHIVDSLDHDSTLRLAGLLPSLVGVDPCQNLCVRDLLRILLLIGLPQLVEYLSLF